VNTKKRYFSFLSEFVFIKSCCFFIELDGFAEALDTAKEKDAIFVYFIRVKAQVPTTIMIPSKRATTPRSIPKDWI
jgi:hypothetical protein